MMGCNPCRTPFDTESKLGDDEPKVKKTKSSLGD